MGIADWIEIGRMDELGRMDTPAHRLDARAKAIVTLVFIGVVMSFPLHEISALTPFLLYPVALISLGRIPARYILKKILVAAPFALVIGIFNPLMDRQPVATIGSFVVTGGWVSFVSIMFRFVLTVGAALALVACTGMYRLGAGLEQLGVPRVFVMQLLFLYRYLFVVADEGVKMMRGVELRSDGTRALRLRVYGSLIGHLLLRSMDRAERVYRAMVARGFDGEIRVLRRSWFRWSDWGFVCGCLAFFLAARMWNLANGLGLLLTGIVP
ncbi:MAG: cobalt ECF transporter T component CbiQ [Deltaproteobacteria bacterium RBG_13_65_10]|nr:MAG: cobalt ECF transporter T component CbiQ [Deltaproteobacteria bacterium RBG_13_65_10]